jgi:hypothetical protein
MELPQPSSLHPRAQTVPAAALMLLLASLVVIVPPRLAAAAIPLSCLPSTLSYGNVTLGVTETLLVAVTNGGTASVTISNATSSNAVFQVTKLKLPQVIAAGATLEVAISFTPGKTGWDGGQISFTSNASNPTLNLGVSGDGVTSESVNANPLSLSFGTVKVGGSSTLAVSVTSPGFGFPITLTGVQITGGAFSVSGPTFPVNLGAGQIVKLNVTFKPKSAGLTGGSFLITGTGVTIPLSGTGAAAAQPQLSLSPATLNFGNVAVGGSSTLAVELIASGGSVTISSAASSSAQFAAPGAAFPLTIPAGQPVSLNITFTPSGDGAASGAFSFASNAVGSPASEALTGTGTAPSVSLSWNASVSQNVAGYNIYRSNSSTGSQTRINSSLDSETSYTDSTVAPGKTYYYSTTAVNTKGQESAHSGQVEVAIP